ncbi:MAG: acetyl-CoA carboxylase carboxyltransferase subunit alpha [Cytophagales bacterium]|nr:acetyl-CoA carboxylase carboxyltransferase subunit alpha [Cytophagales bacterium]
MYSLDFEKPISELEKKLAEMKALADKSQVDVSLAVESLEKKIYQLKVDTFKNLTRWQRIQVSRHPDRPYFLDYIQYMTEDFIELHGDRVSGDDKAIVGGLGNIKGKTYLLIGQQKGRNTKERQHRNFGMANPSGYRKAIRLMKWAEKFGKPVVTLIDTPGAFPGIEAEEKGQAEAIAQGMFTMLQLRVPILCVVIGEGASGGAIAIGVGDRVLMMENTWYSVISPESCSSILWRSWKFKEQAAEMLQPTAEDMKKNGLIDEIIKEPIGGAHRNPREAAHLLSQSIVKEIQDLEKKGPQERIEQRMQKFRSLGHYEEKIHPKKVSSNTKSPKAQ